MNNNNTIQHRLQKAKADNILIGLSMAGLSLVGFGGIFGTLSEAGMTNNERLPQELIARKPLRRIRRRDMVLADSIGSGLKHNSFAAAQ